MRIFARLLPAAFLLLGTLPARAQQAATPPTDQPKPAEKTAAVKPAAASNPEETEGVATGVGNRFLQTYTALTNEKGLFEVTLTHRFPTPVIEAGFGGAWGLDYGNSMGVVFDYTPVKNLSVQLRRVDINADYEFGAKLTLLRPTTSLPLALGLRGGLDWQTASYVEKRSAGFGQLLASVTLGNRVTLSASPACVQRTPEHASTVCNVPLALQLKITRSIAVMAEYMPVKKGIVPDGKAQWSFGVEKAVYHHKFALWIGNSGATNVDQMLAGDYNGGVKDSNIRLGFNLVRQFEIATD